MQYLFIGGTGQISMSITRKLLSRGDRVYLVNRGNRNIDLEGDVVWIQADINKEEAKVAEAIKDLSFDAVADFIAFTPDQLERDFRLFNGRTRQFLTLSSASAYQKAPTNVYVTEGTTMANPYWQYSRDKIACEDYLLKMFRENGFPVTIVRPSHTYDERNVPVSLHGKNGSYQVLARMLAGKPVIVIGDGTSLWTVTTSDDLSKGFIGLLNNPHAIGECFHITSDEALTWNQLTKLAADALGVEAKIVHVSSDFLAYCGQGKYNIIGEILGDKANSQIFDNTKLKRVVPGFEATTFASEGIRRSVAYIKEHPECQRLDPEFDAWCDKVIAAVEAGKAAFKA